MKSTYKLFGTIWDGIVADTNAIMHCDRYSNINTISFKQLLSANTEKEVDTLVNGLNVKERLLINIDYWHSSNLILSSFLEKRLIQIASYLKTVYDFKVIISDIPEKHAPF